MRFNRPMVMSVAGMDPCGGAGLLADIKTFEQHKVYGLAIPTAHTMQTDNSFYTIRWEEEDQVLEGIGCMLSAYPVKAVKIGIVQNVYTLHKIVSSIHKAGAHIKVVLDPVISSSTGFHFWKGEIDAALLHGILQKITLLTPNYKEAVQLVPHASAAAAARHLAQHGPVLLKGGHNEAEPGVDYLYTSTGPVKLQPEVETVFPKHGSGCVLSAAITANLALGQGLETACRNAKSFIENFLNSNSSLLGYHVP